MFRHIGVLYIVFRIGMSILGQNDECTRVAFDNYKACVREAQGYWDQTVCEFRHYVEAKACEEGE